MDPFARHFSGVLELVILPALALFFVGELSEIQDLLENIEVLLVLL